VSWPRVAMPRNLVSSGWHSKAPPLQEKATALIQTDPSPTASTYIHQFNWRRCSHNSVGCYLPSCVCVTSVRRFFKVWPGVRALSGTFWEGEQEMINPPLCLPSDNCIEPVRSRGRGCCHQVWQQSQQSASSCDPDYHIHCNRRTREGLCRTWTPSLIPRLGEHGNEASVHPKSDK